MRMNDDLTTYPDQTELLLGIHRLLGEIRDLLAKPDEPVFPPLPEHYYYPLEHISIEELNISMRTHRALWHDEYNPRRTIGAIMECSEAELLRTPDFGRKSLNDLKVCLWTQFGLKLKER